MTDFLNAISSPVNLGLTAALVLVILYWLMVVLGALAFDTLDVDLDAEPDVDLDMEMDVDPGLDADPDVELEANSIASAGSSSFGLSILRTVGVGEVPLMVLLSFFILTLWMIGVLLHPVVGAWGVLAQVALLIPYGIAAIIITRILTAPLAVIFRRLKAKEQAEQKLDLIGKRCQIVSRQLTDRYGQVQVETDAAPLLLNARLSSGDTVLPKGTEAVIVGQSEDGRYYTVRGF